MNVKLTFPDGSMREFEAGIKVEDVAQAISPSLKKKCVAGKLNGELVNLNKEKNIIIIDINNKIKVDNAEVINFNIDNKTTIDKIHLNDEGNKELFNIIKEKVK
jgi:hypothetical protein